VDAVGSAWPALSVHEQDATVVGLPDQDRKITNIFRDQTALLAGRSCPDRGVIRTHEIGPRRHSYHIVAGAAACSPVRVSVFAGSRR
jgi:hypothetical protein